MLENYYAALESESCMDRSDETLSSVRLLILTTCAALSSVCLFARLQETWTHQQMYFRKL